MDGGWGVRDRGIAKWIQRCMVWRKNTTAEPPPYEKSKFSHVFAKSVATSTLHDSSLYVMHGILFGKNKFCFVSDQSLDDMLSLPTSSHATLLSR